MKRSKVMYLAAHGGFDGAAVPLGGGAAIYNMLVREWSAQRPFELETVTPAVLGADAPSASDLVRYGEREYARFCHRFREAATARVLAEDPAQTAVLVNDVSEGPDFAGLSAAGFRIVTVYHVDVVAYISKIYLRGVVAPWRLTGLWRGVEAIGLDRAAPSILRLIFSQQAASVEYSSCVVVPSHGMRETLLRCYPRLDGERVMVLPWGCPAEEVSGDEAAAAASALRTEYGIEPDAIVLATLSRISPEKGQDLLLQALIEWERDGGPGVPVWLFVCGEAAFMRGGPFRSELERLAARLKSVRVVFPGYVTGARKAGFLALADIYVFPSRHESYGLTLMEAMRAGRPCVAVASDGAKESMGSGGGLLVGQDGAGGIVTGLRAALEHLIAEPGLRSRLGEEAARAAAARPFAAAAATLASRLL